MNIKQTAGGSVEVVYGRKKRIWKMENDLISRGAVLKLIEDIKCNPEVPKNYGTLLDIMRGIREIPVAYDVDKAVEQIEKSSTDEDGVICYVDNKPVITKELAIKFIKSGGID